MSYWSQMSAIGVAREIERIAPRVGAHIGLTGGCLYKDGPRKDLDIVVYRIRQAKEIDRERFFTLLAAIGIVVKSDHGFVVKTEMTGRTIDFLFPGHEDAEYPGRE